MNGFASQKFAGYDLNKEEVVPPGHFHDTLNLCVEFLKNNSGEAVDVVAVDRNWNTFVATIVESHGTVYFMAGTVDRVVLVHGESIINGSEADLAISDSKRVATEKIGRTRRRKNEN